MTLSAPLIESIKDAADRHGFPTLAQEAGVPYQTLMSLKRRGFRPQHVETILKLAAASERLMAETPLEAAHPPPS